MARPGIMTSHAGGANNQVRIFDSFTTTIRDSIVASFVHTNGCCASGDILYEGPTSTIAIPGDTGEDLITSEASGKLKIFVTDGWSNTIVDSWFTPKWEPATPTGIPINVTWDGTDLYLSDEGQIGTGTFKYFQYTGKTSTIQSSFTLSEGASQTNGRLPGIGWRDDADDDMITTSWDTVGSAATSVLVRQHAGFSSTVTDSYTFDSGGAGNTGLDWNDDYPGVLANHFPNTVFQFDGFGSTIDDSIFGGGGAPSARGLYYLPDGLILSVNVLSDQFTAFTTDVGVAAADGKKLHFPDGSADVVFGSTAVENLLKFLAGSDTIVWDVPTALAQLLKLTSGSADVVIDVNAIGKHLLFSNAQADVVFDTNAISNHLFFPNAQADVVFDTAGDLGLLLGLSGTAAVVFDATGDLATLLGLSGTAAVVFDIDTALVGLLKFTSAGGSIEFNVSADASKVLLEAALEGLIEVGSLLAGDIETDQLLEGTTDTPPLLEGENEAETLLEGQLDTPPLLRGVLVVKTDRVD